MGVKNLWDILDPVKHRKELGCLRGKVLAVDLSVWICQAKSTHHLKDAVRKPHLRNLFYRVLFLQKLGVRLLFITDGDAPELKRSTVIKRLNSRRDNAAQRHQQYTGKRGGQFTMLVRECCELLDCLGIPVMASNGEAEAACAALNLQGVVDGCITDDGDAFLFGAKTVYRDITISAKDQHVYCYDMDEITKDLGLSQRNLIAVALLLGCDYYPGVNGVGKETIAKLVVELPGIDLLQRLKTWMSEDSTPFYDAGPTERLLMRKIKQQCKPISEQIINAYLQSDAVACDPPPTMTWTFPRMRSLKEFCLKHLEWPKEYTTEKVLPLITGEFLRRLSNGADPVIHLTAERVIGLCKRQHIPMCKIEWKADDGARRLLEMDGSTFITEEPQLMMIMNFPTLAIVDKLLEKKSRAKIQKGKAGNQNTTTNDCPAPYALESEVSPIDQVCGKTCNGTTGVLGNQDNSDSINKISILIASDKDKSRLREASASLPSTPADDSFLSLPLMERILKKMDTFKI